MRIRWRKNMSPVKMNDLLEPVKDKLGQQRVQLKDVASFSRTANRWRSPITGQFVSTREALKARKVVADENSLRRIQHAQQVDRETAESILGDYYGFRDITPEEDLKGLRGEIFGFESP